MINKELMAELEKVPEGTRYVDSPNFSEIARLLKESAPYIRNTASPVLGTTYDNFRNTCNRHSNCEQAAKDWLNNHGMEKYVPVGFHCHDDECEDCFGC